MKVQSNISANSLKKGLKNVYLFFLKWITDILKKLLLFLAVFANLSTSYLTLQVFLMHQANYITYLI